MERFVKFIVYGSYFYIGLLLCLIVNFYNRLKFFEERPVFSAYRLLLVVLLILVVFWLALLAGSFLIFKSLLRSLVFYVLTDAFGTLVVITCLMLRKREVRSPLNT